MVRGLEEEIGIGTQERSPGYEGRQSGKGRLSEKWGRSDRRKALADVKTVCLLFEAVLGKSDVRNFRQRR